MAMLLLPTIGKTKGIYKFIEFNHFLLALSPNYYASLLLCWFLIFSLSYVTNFCVISINKTHLCRQLTANSQQSTSLWKHLTDFSPMSDMHNIHFLQKQLSNQLNTEYFTLSSRLHVISHITDKPIQPEK